MNPIPHRPQEHALAHFHALAEVPAESEWFLNITNANTRRAYKRDILEFMLFNGIDSPQQFREVARIHVITWRDELRRRDMAAATINRKLSALASLFDYLCDKNTVSHNPVDGVTRPRVDITGKTPALSDDQAQRLLAAPDTNTLKGIRDRAILAALLYHALRREELCKLTTDDMQLNRGNWYFRVTGKGEKARLLLVHPVAIQSIQHYLEIAGHRSDLNTPLFRSFQGKSGKQLDTHINPASIYRFIVLPYAKQAGVYARGVGPHALRATAATSALDHGADIASVQEWLGHANIDTTRRYDRRNMKPEHSPALKVGY